ncbi:MerR family transcriptional regulator [Paeniroseomonas aquatica]|uniref:MerR family transcriptional regulator n=1 Tax=Paeniroseomonas aquatica TaxID=373043 RepID=A0ABT8A5C8_9PROT|nr:MerR family transcriptional regulator [Paeniroseomonas aquatica]MDN3564891.1 MerR family transcriptional regulator [Paeniroseomonas aquatica]
MNIIELAEVVGETPRQIRYLIAEGFIPNPDGSRARPEYRESHVEAIRRYQRLRQDYKPAQIRILLEAEAQARDAERIPLAPGVTLVITPALLAADTHPRAIGDRAEAALRAFLQHPTKEPPDAG